jgi:hypothetical protein
VAGAGYVAAVVERLAVRLDRSLRTGDLVGIGSADPVDERDELVSLLRVHDLSTAPLQRLGEQVRHQAHPEVVALKARLEERLLSTLTAWVPVEAVTDADPAAAMRHIARVDDAPIYDWVATTATWQELLTFLAIEGGPDGGFDDLVATCQIGLRGQPKLVLGANYWDEMGRGDAVAVHTTLHQRLVEAISMPRVPTEDLPLSALRRSALNGFLATNRWLQPEMIGALGLLELQAGPRCRRVVQALRRLGAPAGAFPFYEEHASADPLHGKAWLDGAVRPLAEEQPDWGPRIVRGARWRAEVNRRLFDELFGLLVGMEVSARSG